MTRQPALASRPHAHARSPRMSPARGISATWWYTVSAVVFLEFMVVLVWAATLLETGHDAPVVLIVGIGGLLWWASTFVLLVDYRRRTEDAPLASWPRAVAPLLFAAVFGVTAGLVSGVWLIAALPLIQSLVLLDWPPGVRVRAVIAATVVLGAFWFLDSRLAFVPGSQSWWLLGFFTTFLPMMTVLSLWWWDVLVTVDRARASEARLAATQERLRVATDVHDLQGHHLQVIALQLELAERLMPHDPAGALAQLRAARGSVDEARQGTRDLALRFRSVPLGDEIANAADLLRAAGTSVRVTVDAAADRAPASVLGPVIRETTTNVLRHGAGRWARLSLRRDSDAWRYEIENDAPESAVAGTDGSGLEGIGRRLADVDGTVEVRRGAQEFAVVVRVPTSQDAQR